MDVLPMLLACVAILAVMFFLSTLPRGKKDRRDDEPTLKS